MCLRQCRSRAPRCYITRERRADPFGSAGEDDEASDLHGLPRHDARRSTGARGDDAILHREVRQRGEPEPSIRLEGEERGGGRKRSPTDWRDPKEYLPAVRRIEQPRTRAPPRCTAEGQARHHVRHRAQGGGGHGKKLEKQGLRVPTAVRRTAAQIDDLRAAITASPSHHDSDGNNEIGVIKPIAEIGADREEKGILFTPTVAGGRQRCRSKGPREGGLV